LIGAHAVPGLFDTIESGIEADFDLIVLFLNGGLGDKNIMVHKRLKAKRGDKSDKRGALIKIN
jgi:hypothetical protein